MKKISINRAFPLSRPHVKTMTRPCNEVARGLAADTSGVAGRLSSFGTVALIIGGIGTIACLAGKLKFR